MRYPAGRFFVLLADTDRRGAERFARRLSWDWDSYLRRDLRVATKVCEVDDGDIAECLRGGAGAG